MANAQQLQRRNFFYIISICLVLIGTFIFSFYAFSEKKIAKINKNEIVEANVVLKRQIAMITASMNSLKNETMVLNTAQIYESVSENANRYQIKIKSFTPTNDPKETNDLLISLIGTYPKAIYFFEGLHQQKLGKFKKIEIKKYDQEPKSSVEILMTLTASPEGARKK